MLLVLFAWASLLVAGEVCVKTGADIEGPFRWGNAQTFSTALHTPYPLRSDLLVSASAKQCPVPEQLLFQGTLSNINCQPLSGYRVEIWGASRKAVYSPNTSASYRGAAITDSQGKFSFNTVFPAPYPNGGQLRPSHIHMEVRDPTGREVLTTQYYFEGDPYIRDDPWASEAASDRILPLTKSLTGQLLVQPKVVIGATRTQ
jgi:protocatechuate 3,4-dioxygenase beta subunit